MTTIKNSLKALQPGLNALFAASYKGLKPGMNVSELIAELGKIYLAHGDLPIDISIAGPQYGVRVTLSNVNVNYNAKDSTQPYVELFGDGD